MTKIIFKPTKRYYDSFISWQNQRHTKYYLVVKRTTKIAWLQRETKNRNPLGNIFCCTIETEGNVEQINLAKYKPDFILRADMLCKGENVDSCLPN
jgi:hypothetical protein